MEGLSQVDKDDINVKFEENSLNIHIMNLKKLNYQLIFTDLLHSINVDKSLYKISKDILYITMKKESKTKWECLKKQDKKKTPALKEY